MIFHVLSNSTVSSVINQDKKDIDEIVDGLEILLEKHIAIHYSVRVRANDLCVHSIEVQIKDIFGEKNHYFETIENINSNKTKLIVSLSDMIPEIESLLETFLRSFMLYRQTKIYHFSYEMNCYNVDFGKIPEVPLARNQTVKINYASNPTNKYNGSIEFENRIDGRIVFKIFVEYFAIDSRHPTVVAHCQSTTADIAKRFLEQTLCDDNFPRQLAIPGRFNLKNSKFDNDYPLVIGRPKYSRELNSCFFVS